jgi:hypothetical protein
MQFGSFAQILRLKTLTLRVGKLMKRVITRFVLGEKLSGAVISNIKTEGRGRKGGGNYSPRE